MPYRMQRMVLRLQWLMRRVTLLRKRRQIDEAAAATEVLARTFFGDAAYLRRDIEIDRETGEEYVVFDVHYGFSEREAEDNFDRLVALHQEFTSAFVRTVGRDIQYLIVLGAIPTEADPSTASTPVSDSELQ